MRYRACALFLAWTSTLLLATMPAAAWGPRAHKAIVAMASQVVSESHHSLFEAGEANYEMDALRGALDGRQILDDLYALDTSMGQIAAIGAESQLLHAAQQYGQGSYFAYRMGALAALVADVVLPYGIATGVEDGALAEDLKRDIDRRLDSFRFDAEARGLRAIQSPRLYFTQQRRFYDQDRRLIREDYASGAGYDGFLLEAGPAYFRRAVEAVGDSWHTILVPGSQVSMTDPSPRTLAAYFVDEMEYLLLVKRNLRQAEATYRNFTSVNPNAPDLLERVGDLFYAYGEPSAIDRAVREWSLAYDIGGTERRRIAGKLSNHYLRVGNAFIDRASAPGSEDSDLPNALAAFERALDFDRTSDEAATLIETTNVAIKERQERFQLAQSLIATGDQVAVEADKQKSDGAFSSAILDYRQAVSFYEAVDDEFPQLATVALENIRRMNRQVSGVINDIVQRANDTIAQADSAVDTQEYDEAIRLYGAVEGILDAIPDDANQSVLNDRQDLVQIAAQKEEDAKVQQIRYNEALQERQRAQQAAGA